MAIKIREITGCDLHASTVRRWLPAAGLVWRRTAPTLRIRDPRKDEKMAAINTALAHCSREHPVFYEDEVDIHLNPKTGADWQLRGQQKKVVTPGQIIHKSRETLSWLKQNPKFRVIYQPVYSPWVNHVERLWHALHETITRHHRCRSMWQLLQKVRYFMKTVSPFPGDKHRLAKV